MKKFVPFIALILTVSISDAQYKMYINTISGKVDSLQLSQIINVGFQSSPGYDSTITLWEDHPGNPILRKSKYDAISTGIYIPHLLYTDSSYKMWFSLRSPNGGVGYAASVDGVQWTHIDKRSVLEADSTSSWDSLLVAAGPVIKKDTLYHMFYTGYDGIMLRIGLAISSDGINWIKNQSPVLSPTESWETNNIGATSVIKTDSLFYLYYHGVNEQSKTAIGVATSLDGITWTKYGGNPILTASEPWEGGEIYFPSVIKDSESYKMVYASRNTNGFGMASSFDGKSWSKISSTPFFSLQTSQIPWANSIGYPCFINIGDKYRVYYAGVLISGPEYDAIGFTEPQKQSISLRPTDSMFVEMYNGMKLWYSVTEIHEITFSSEVITGREQQLIQHIVSSFALRQNYPNPFNPSTTIEYSIPDRGNVHVNIYDIQGRLVSILEQTPKEAGDHKVVWNGRTTNGIPVSSGTYFCSVEFNGNVLVKKLVLIK
ncbi:MAG: FlgD immunoglobulin-like domain containing protein [Bacteroidota bacterium]|jgi:predicted GH43/DUF377 family glycosyl hydrolase